MRKITMLATSPAVMGADTVIFVIFIVALILLLIFFVCVALLLICAEMLGQLGGVLDIESARGQGAVTPTTDEERRRLKTKLVKKALHFLCCQVACPPCPEQIIAKVVFHPPKPPTYTIKPDPADASRLLLDIPRLSSTGLKHIQRTPQVFFIDISEGNRIACFFFGPNPQYKYTIVHSHGNIADLGTMFQFYEDAVKLVKCNLLVYDYRGYGASTGRTTEASIKEDIMAVASVLQSKFNIKPEKWILFGSSIGSVPTLHLAAQPAYKVAGIIIESGVLSAFRALFPERRHNSMPKCCNPFDNQVNLSKIKCPILFAHGTKDKIIPFSIATEMHQLCPSAVAPFWLPEAGHNDVGINPQFRARMKQFITKELGEKSPTATTTSTSSSLSATKSESSKSSAMSNKTTNSQQSFTTTPFPMF